MDTFVGRGKSRAKISREMLGLVGGVSLLALATVPTRAEDDTLRIISLNTWGAAWLVPEATDLYTAGNYDVITIQEYNTSYGDDLQAKLPYTVFAISDTGLASTLPMTTGRGGEQGTPYMKLAPQGGRPATIVATEHLNYYDDPFDWRVGEAKQLNAWAGSEATPIILTGDFNAGDVSERGLLEVVQQELMLTRARETGNADYKAWALQYVARNHAPGSEKYAAAEAYIEGTSGIRPTDLFSDETYPVAGNTPYTINILKKEFQLLQNPEDREPFVPHELADGSTTWPSVGEDDEAFKWPSWGRTQIDHFLVSRPYAKWWELVDPADDPYVGGVLDQSVSTRADGLALSDHEPVAHEMRWMGPRIEAMGDAGDQVRLIFDAEASGLGAASEFQLSRNNGRTDVYLGQLSDANGQPIYRLPEAIPEDQLAFLVSNAIYDRHDTAPYQAQLAPFVPDEKRDNFDNYVAELLDPSSGDGYYRNVIQNYFDAHRDEFPGISGIAGMSWEQWGYILMDYLSDDLTFQTIPNDALEELWSALDLDDPETRALLSQQTGLDFENDPYAPLKLQLDCASAQQLALQGGRDLCVDDHGRFKDIAVTDGKTVAIDDGEALGSSDGIVTLDHGGIRTAGPDDAWAAWTDPVTRIDKAIQLDGLGWVDVSHPTAPVEMAQSISGPGSFEKRGPGVLELNAVNSYTGSTTVTAGTLRAGAERAFVEGGVYIITGGTLDLGGYDLTMSAFSGKGGALAIGASAITLDQAGDTTYAGSISGDGRVAKIGAGRLELTGDGSAFTGTTEVVQGLLAVNGRLGGNVDVAGGTLGGTGTVGATTVADGGILAPGNSIGVLTVDGALTLSSGSILDYEFGGPGVSTHAPGVSDRIDVTGALTLAGVLNLSHSGDSADGATGLGYYRLMTYGGALSGDGLTIGGTPVVADASRYEVQTGAGNVDLFIASSGDGTLQHWQGGDGAWGATNKNWLNQDGETLVVWAGNHAIFKNQPGDFNGGTIAVEGTQSFKGLQFVDEGYRLEGDGVLQTEPGGSEIRVLAGSAVVETEITGTGGIVKTEAGTLILSGQNTYQGDTTISGGTVQAAEDANLGAASGGLGFNGGILATTAGFDSGRTVSLSGSGTFDVADGTTLDLAGTVSGTGDLIKRGDGTLSLSGENAYGSTFVEAGTLIGNASSVSGDIANAGTTVFDQVANTTFTGNITGYGGNDGTMVKLGAGELTLKGTSTLDWTIDQGGLTTVAERFAGDVTISTNGAFTFDQAATAVYAGVISGQGIFSIRGNGTVSLTGDSTGFAGTTTVGGTLLVADAKVGGSVNVLDGAILGGSGTVGSGAGSLVRIASGGTLLPGHSIGTLTVDGDLIFASGSIYEVEANPKGADSDLVEVTGTVTLNGGSVAHIGSSGNYDLRSTYTILSAGELDGAFEGVASDFAFLTPDLLYDYDLGTVDLDLVRNERNFASTALTRNQIATANGIESIGFDAGHPVYDAIAQLADDNALIRASFDVLSGEIHASAKSALIEDSRVIRDAGANRIRAAFNAVGASAVPVLAYGPDGAELSAPDEALGLAAWGQAFGSWGSFDGNGNAAGLETSTGGFLLGADAPLGDWRLGLLAGYSHASFDADARHSSGSSDNYHLGLYGGTQWGNLGFRSGLAYSLHDVETSRFVAIPGLADGLKSGYDASTFQAFGEFGYRIDTPTASFEPFGNLAYVRLHTDGFSEQGGAAALSGASSTMETTFTTLGLRASTEVALGEMQATARGMIGWRHAFGDTTALSTHAFAGSDAFTVAGTPIAENAAVIGAGFDLNLTDATTLGLSYQGQFGDGVQQNGFDAKFQVRF